jgi:hypothetical protein
MSCDGCKWKRFRLWSWLSGTRDARKLYNHCRNPEVTKHIGDEFPFCHVALMWPCTEGKLKEAK